MVHAIPQNTRMDNINPFVPKSKKIDAHPGKQSNLLF